MYSLRLPPALVARVDAVAAEREERRTDLIERAIESELHRIEKVVMGDHDQKYTDVEMTDALRKRFGLPDVPDYDAEARASFEALGVSDQRFARGYVEEPDGVREETDDELRARLARLLTRACGVTTATLLESLISTDDRIGAIEVDVDSEALVILVRWEPSMPISDTEAAEIAAALESAPARSIVPVGYTVRAERMPD